MEIYESVGEKTFAYYDAFLSRNAYVRYSLTFELRSNRKGGGIRPQKNESGTQICMDRLKTSP